MTKDPVVNAFSRWLKTEESDRAYTLSRSSGRFIDAQALSFRAGYEAALSDNASKQSWGEHKKED